MYFYVNFYVNAKSKSLELIINYQSECFPTKGGLLLFGKNRDKLFADPLVGEKSPKTVDQTPRVSEETLLWNGKGNLVEIGTPLMRCQSRTFAIDVHVRER
jgi:hypothetical protein